MLPGFTQREDENDDSVDVIARGCEVLDVVLHKNWNGSLSGHVARADGKPAPGGIHVDLIRADTDVPEGDSGLLFGSTVQTDDQGNYSFEGVAPGRYKVVLTYISRRPSNIHLLRCTGRARARKRPPPRSRSQKQHERSVTSTCRFL